MNSLSLCVREGGFEGWGKGEAGEAMGDLSAKGNRFEAIDDTRSVLVRVMLDDCTLRTSRRPPEATTITTFAICCCSLFRTSASASAL